MAGVITSIAPFGAFVRVAEGVEGLLHLSEMPNHNSVPSSDSLQEGQAVQVRVMEIDASQQRMRLSLRKLNERGNGSSPKGERGEYRRNIP